jgi:hypothetical protein
VVSYYHGGDEYSREYVVSRFQISTFNRLKLPGLVLGSHVLTVQLRAMLDRNEFPPIRDIDPEACPGVDDKREALNMYETFEQFTSSPADQRTERVQYALIPISSPPGY